MNRSLHRALVLLTAASALLGLLGAGAGAHSTTPPHIAERPSLGCAIPEAPLTGDDLTLASGGVSRHALVHVPASLPSGPAPLVVSFHPAAFGSSVQAQLDGLDGRADADGFISVHPDGLVDPTSHAQVWSIGVTPQVRWDDVAFVRDLLRDIERRWCVDRNRVFATGLSNGGGMTVLLACRTQLFAAVAPVSPLWPTPSCRPQRPTPVIAFQGLADKILPYAGGDARYGDAPHHQPGAEVWTAQWARVNGCAARPDHHAAIGQAHLIEWRTCRSATQLWQLGDGGHSWPGSVLSYTAKDLEPLDCAPNLSAGWARMGITCQEGAASTAAVNTDISATDRELEFFADATPR